MWARDLEIGLGLWLAASPFVFDHAADERFLWAHDLVLATLVLILAWSSYARRTRWAHWWLLPVGAWLVAFGWWGTLAEPVPAASQNHVLVGLILMMFAIIPNDVLRPPPGWRREEAGREAGRGGEPAHPAEDPS